jgi:hypothetical protein
MKSRQAYSFIALISLLVMMALDAYPAHAKEGESMPAPLLLYFRSDNCTKCETLDQLLKEEAIQSQLEGRFVTAYLNIDEQQGRACAKIYAVTQVPAVVIADHQGNILYRSAEVFSPDDILRIIASSPDLVIRDATIGSALSTHMRPLPELHSLSLPALCAIPGTRPGRTVVNLPPSRVPYFDTRRSLPRAKTVAIVARSETLVPDSKNTVSSTSPDSKRDETDTDPGVVDRTSWQYAIQIGFFSSRQNTDKLIREAQRKGVTDIRTDITERHGKQFFRVLSGSYSSLREAQVQLEHVQSLGLSAAIYRW